jgi:hypothetical protein
VAARRPGARLIPAPPPAAAAAWQVLKAAFPGTLLAPDIVALSSLPPVRAGAAMPVTSPPRPVPAAAAAGCAGR